MNNKFMDFMSQKLMPLATKISNLKYLKVLRNAFISTMPIVMCGSIALLINAFLVDFLNNLVLQV